MQCFLLDDNAVLLYSSNPNDVSANQLGQRRISWLVLIIVAVIRIVQTVGVQFLQVFSVLMHELVKRVYTRVDVADHQRVCEARIPPPVWSAGSRVVSVSSKIHFH